MNSRSVRVGKSELVLIAGLLGAVGAWPWACGGKTVVDPAGSGGQGGTTTNTTGTTSTTLTTTTSSTTSTTLTTSTTVTTTTTTTGTVICDNTGDCGLCQDCAVNGPCDPAVQACWNNQQCLDLLDCFSNCFDDPCYNQCWNDHPGGQEDYMNLVYCVVCDQCYDDCDGASSGC